MDGPWRADCWGDMECLRAPARLSCSWCWRWGKGGLQEVQALRPQAKATHGAQVGRGAGIERVHWWGVEGISSGAKIRDAWKRRSATRTNVHRYLSNISDAASGVRDIFGKARYMYNPLKGSVAVRRDLLIDTTGP
jgi:hypothetical protein